MESVAILGIPPGRYPLWELCKLSRIKKEEAWDRVIVICAAFTGKVMPNPYAEVVVLPWAGWGAYGIGNEYGKDE